MRTKATPPPNPEVRPEALAYALGISTRQVQNLAEKGIAKRTKSGAYDLLESVRGYVEFLKDDRKAKAGTYEAAKLREKAAKARLAEAAADKEEGRLLDVDDVIAACGGIVSAFTTRLNGFGESIASICHEQPGDFIAARVNDGLRSALKELAKMPYVK